jgi:hypothetical protein
MIDTTIPPAAAEALSDAVADLLGERLSLYEARAACLAMLKNWPGMRVHQPSVPPRPPAPRAAIILPLPKEPSNDT